MGTCTHVWEAGGLQGGLGSLAASVWASPWQQEALQEGVPDLPVAPQDEAGLTTTFQTWPRGWFHIPKDPDFPVPS